VNLAAGTRFGAAASRAGVRAKRGRRVVGAGDGGGIGVCVGRVVCGWGACGVSGGSRGRQNVLRSDAGRRAALTSSSVGAVGWVWGSSRRGAVVVPHGEGGTSANQVGIICHYLSLFSYLQIICNYL